MSTLNILEKEELCPKCKSGYLKPTDDPRKLICHFCGTSQLHLTLKDIEDGRDNRPFSNW
jgi:hypothetical protein